MRKLLPLVALVFFAAPAVTQEKEDRTLLGWDQMRAIINEASGERAMHHLLELVPYQRVRPLSEYQGHFRESEVMARFAREYGFSNVAIESFENPDYVIAFPGWLLDDYGLPDWDSFSLSEAVSTLC